MSPAESGTEPATFSEMFVKCRLGCVALAGAGLLLMLSFTPLRANDSTLSVGSNHDFAGSYTSTPQGNDATTNKYPASSCSNVWLETIVERRSWTDPILLTLSNVQFTVCVTTNGHLAAWNCTNSPAPGYGWTEMPDTQLASAQFARVTLQAIYNRDVNGFYYFRVWLNGTLSENPQTWYATEGIAQKQFGNLPAPVHSIIDELVVTPLSIIIPNARRTVNDVTSLDNRVWATSDLSSPLSWQVVSTNLSGAVGSWLFTDSDTISYPDRFSPASVP
jgi:hypothetical protein